jgi:endonuclease III
LEDTTVEWQSIVKWVDKRLEETHRSPNHGNYTNPTNELFYILLTKKTNPTHYQPIFKKLLSKYRSWESLLSEEFDELESILRPLGMSNLRASQFIKIAKQLKSDFGKVTLAPLKRMLTADAKSYLVHLPGVGEKSARCVLMYSLGRDVSPMDTHAIRVMYRLGLLPDTNPSNAHRIIDERLPSGMAYRLHVNLVAHGKKICTSKNPTHRICSIKEACWYFARLDDQASFSKGRSFASVDN